MKPAFYRDCYLHVPFIRTLPYISSRIKLVILASFMFGKSIKHIINIGYIN